MSRMIPPYISVHNWGEKRVFEWFKTAPGTEDWYVLHSYNLPSGVRGPGREIDFVVLAPRLGIFCLEVKSGQVQREGGIWTISDGRGNSYTDAMGPFCQAERGFHMLVDKIHKEFGKGSRLGILMYGYGVVFPDIKFEWQDAEINKWTVLDKTQIKKGICQYIKRLSRNFVKAYENYNWFEHALSMPGQTEVEQLVNFLRGDFHIVLSPKQKIKHIENKMAGFTRQQCRCLDSLEENPRCLFKGPAGTGKTMLALEAAKKSIYQGRNTLVACFNIMLGQWFKLQLSKLGLNNFYAGPFLEYLKEITGSTCTEAHLLEDYYKRELPRLALKALQEEGRPKYNTLIVDEGQDLIGEELIRIMDLLLKGGISGGNWYFFCDFERQNIFNERKDSRQMLEILRQRSSFAIFSLDTNCRNTREIAQETYRLTGFKPNVLLKDQLSGNPVKYYFYDRPERQAELIGKVLQKLEQQRVPKKEITILSPHRMEHSRIGLLDSYQFINLSQSPEGFFDRKKLTFSTIQKFKGMENSYILLIDLDNIKNEKYFKTLLYIGMSRAKMELMVFMGNNVKHELNIGTA